MKHVHCATLILFTLPSLGWAGDNLAKPTNLDKLNAEADEDNPFAAGDGVSLFYDSNRSGRFEILVSRRTASTQPWGPGKVFLASKDYDCRSPFLRGTTLFFAQNKVPDEKLKDLKNFDLYQKQGMMAPLPLIGVGEQQDELHPWITPAGKEFYFSRKLDTGWTLFVANGPTPGPIGKARPVGFPPGFCHATLASNGLTMYLQGPLEGDRIGLFRAKRAKVGDAWGKPEPLTMLNHPKSQRGDMSPCLTADGNRLYFASDRPEGKGGLDLWTIAVKELK